MTEPAHNTDGLILFIDQWRDKQQIVGDQPLTLPEIASFTRDLQQEITSFSLKPERDADAEPGKFDQWKDNAKVIPYSGNAGDIPCWKLVSAMSANGGGDVFYISDTPAGRVLNDAEVRLAVAATVGGNDVDFGNKLADNIFDGPFENGVRSKFAVDDVIALNDFVSDRLMREMAAGDVRTATPAALPDRVFMQTELPALLQNERVSAINGIPIDTLRQVLEDTGSMAEVDKRVAQASGELLDGLRYVTETTGSPALPRVAVVAVDTTKFFDGSGVQGATFDAGDAKVDMVVIAAAPRSAVQARSEIAVLSIHDTHTAAFQDLGHNHELSRIMSDAATRIGQGTQPPFALTDTNGNTVGSYQVVDTAPTTATPANAARLQIDLGQPEFAQQRDARLSQYIQQAAEQVAAQPVPTGGAMTLTAPGGQSIGTLYVNPPANRPAPMMAPPSPGAGSSPAP